MTALVNDRNRSTTSATPDRGHRLDARQGPWIADLATDRRRRGGQRRGEERAPALALAALEVPVRGADRVLARGQLIAVHRDAHRAAGLAPLGAGRLEDRVETLALGLPLHLVGSGDDHHPDAV